MTLEQQVKDWEKIKDLCNLIRNSYGEQREKRTKQLYHDVKVYAETYKTKFDYTQKPNDTLNI